MSRSLGVLAGGGGGGSIDILGCLCPFDRRRRDGVELGAASHPNVPWWVL